VVEQNADAAVAEAAKNSPAMHEMERVNDKVIAAYNDHDAARFAEVFSPTAVPPPNDDYFRNVIMGLYHEEFGGITGKKLTGETNLDLNHGMLVYEITCKKGIRAKISTNFRRESGQLRVVQWRMEKM
jgi:hypothetical protein